MVIKDFLHRATNMVRSLAHYGRLGKVASRRTFLLRERKKFLIKVGEKTVVFAKQKKIHSPELLRLVSHVEKFEELLLELDYGGRDGTSFHHPKKKERPIHPRRGRKSKK